ncbi:MAG TPA: threonylcarbamoyl-AMP synthase [Deltaproteobacteria bacterium]|nr:threonylcarbamoyl-AMP synthase [Deltaproteobacteria bacterium]
MRIIIEADKPKPRAIKRVAEILSAGGIIVYPTDTVYGLGCCITNKKGIDRINSIKASVKPRSIMFSDIKSMSMYAKISNEAFRVLRNLLPGPYTIILPATRLVPRLLQSNRKSIGVRIPDHWFCKAIVDEIGEPIITTSVPLYHERLHIDPVEIDDDLGHRVDVIVDSGILPDIPSTMVSLETGIPQVIREGLGPVDIFG